MEDVLQRGELFILSAPSGAGKTTLIQSLLDSEDPDLAGIEFSVSYTTREPREGERDGADYHFVDLPRFEAMIAADEFLEWAEVHGNYYGTARNEVDPRLEAGMDVILDIDVQGAERVRLERPEAHSIFVIPPSHESLEERLRRRGLDGEGEIARRLAVSLWELERYREYDYVIINVDADRAGRALAAVVLAQRHRLKRVESEIAGLLDGFRRAGSED